MSTFYKPTYFFKLIDYHHNYTIIEHTTDLIYKYLLIKVNDKNRDCDEQEYSFFISLEKLYLIRNGLSITIGNVNKEFTLTNYTKSDADETYNKLISILSIHNY